MSDDLKIQQIRSLMDNPLINRTSEIRSADLLKGTSSVQAGGKVEPLAETLKQSIAEINDLQLQADKAMADLATGKSSDVQETIMAVEKADISFKMMMEVRNKIISAYQEVMRTQV